MVTHSFLLQYNYGFSFMFHLSLSLLFTIENCIMAVCQIKRRICLAYVDCFLVHALIGPNLDLLYPLLPW